MPSISYGNASISLSVSQGRRLARLVGRRLGPPKDGNTVTDDDILRFVLRYLRGQATVDAEANARAQSAASARAEIDGEGW